MVQGRWFDARDSVQVVLSRLFCPGGAVQVVLSRWFCPGGSVQVVLSSWFCPGCSVQVVLSGCSVQVVLCRGCVKVKQGAGGLQVQATESRRPNEKPRWFNGSSPDSPGAVPGSNPAPHQPTANSSRLAYGMAQHRGLASERRQ